MKQADIGVGKNPEEVNGKRSRTSIPIQNPSEETKTNKCRVDDGPERIQGPNEEAEFTSSRGGLKGFRIPLQRDHINHPTNSKIVRPAFVRSLCQHFTTNSTKSQEKAHA
jgi:hypothetical protein